MNSNKYFRKSVDGKKITSIILTAIMLLSVFSGISASVVGNNNRIDNNVADPVGGEGVGAMAVGSLAASLNSQSPSSNIANESANYTDVFWIRFTASGESANLTSLAFTEAGTIHGTNEITGIGINDTGGDLGNILVKGTFSADNGTVVFTIPGGFEVPVGTLKDLYIWVNTSSSFDLGDTIKLTLTSFNATGLASGQAVTTSGTPLSSTEIAGTGKLTLAAGPSDIAARSINAGLNTTGIVLAQLNFSTTDIEGCTLNTVMLTEIGYANGTKDFSAIYLVNDTNSNGTWDSNEPIIGTTATAFSMDNGTATISGIDEPITKGSWITVLVVVNTTSYFWSGDTLRVNITNATDYTATGTTSGSGTGNYNTYTSSATTGLAMIQVEAGARQPYLNYVLQGQRALIEGSQFNFTAIAGQVNITQITLEQAVKTNWSYTSINTFPRIYIDEDEDGNVTALDTPLNLTAVEFSADNLTMASYDPVNITGNFSDYAVLENGTVSPHVRINNLTNDTYTGTEPAEEWWYNISITYVSREIQTNTTWLNVTNVTAEGKGVPVDGSWWDIGIDPSEAVKDITAISVVSSKNVSSIDLDIVADSCVIDVILNTNITVGSDIETDVGQASKHVILAVCTTADWISGNHTKVVPNTITKYGNFSNYVAIDNTTGQQTRIYQNNNPLNTTIKQLGAVAIGAVASPLFEVMLGANTPTSNVGKNTNLNPVLQLTFSYGGTVDGLSSSTAYLRELVVSTNGTINEAGNVTACLVLDSNGDGAVSPGEAIVATTAYATDNQTIKLVPSSPIEITVDNSLNVTAEGLTAYAHVLIAVNTSSDIVLGETVRLYMDNSSVDYIADLGTMMLINATVEQVVGNDLYAAGSITATRQNVVLDGTVSDRVSETYVELMQLRFTASTTEAVNITRINVTWNGTGNGYNKTSGIGIINDTDMDGMWDRVDTEQVLNKTTFGLYYDVAFLNLSWNDKEITVPAGGSTYVLLYVNTTAANINTSDSIAVNITATPYLNYSANGTDSAVAIADLQTTVISSATKTAVWTGSMRLAGYNLTDHTWIEGAQTDFPVLALNFTAINETSNIGSIILTASGTANETGGNVTVKLVEDVAPFGSYEGETVLATGTFGDDNAAVLLTPSTDIQVVAGTSKYVLVIADISANIEAGTSLVTSVNNPSTDYNATGYYSGARIQDSSTTAVSNTTWSTGAITVSLGTNNTIAGAVDARNQSFVEVMQLNFSATPNMENVTIWGINLTFLGTDAFNDTWNVGIVNDSNNNGLIDSDEPVLGVTSFDVNGTAVISYFTTNMSINGSLDSNRTCNSTIVYVNTTNTFNVTDTLQIRLNSYNATGMSSDQLLTGSGVTQTSNILTGTGNVTVIEGGADVPNNENVSAGANTSVVVWQFRVEAGTVENVTINSIDITEAGTAHAAQDIVSVFLVNDTDMNGKWNTSLGDSSAISDAGTFSSDNGRTTLTLTANNTIKVGASVNYLLVVNTASTFYEGETLVFTINRSTTNGEPTRLQGVTATGETSGVTVYVNNMTSPASNTTVGYASINLYEATQTTVGIYNTTDTNKEVLKVNFGAPLGAVNISSITLKENGSAVITAANRGITAVSVWYNGYCYNTTNGDGWTENGTLTLRTYLQPGCGMIVNGTTNEVTVTVNTSTNLVAGQTIAFDINTTLGTGFAAAGNVSVRTPESTARGNLSNTITVQGAVGQISLVAGWNFISIPKKQDTTMDTFGELLSGIDFSTAYTYSASTGTFTQLTSGDSVQVLYGYWVYVNTPGTVYLSYLTEGQTVPASRALTGDAWNAIGFSNTTAQMANVTLASVQGSWSTVLGWNAASQIYDDAIIYQWNDNTNMMPYKGYWIWMTQDDVLSAISA